MVAQNNEICVTTAHYAYQTDVSSIITATDPRKKWLAVLLFWLNICNYFNMCYSLDDATIATYSLCGALCWLNHPHLTYNVVLMLQN